MRRNVLPIACANKIFITANNTEEIRVLALREINGKLKRIIASQNAGDPPVVNINGAFLVKSLVRWFGSVPLREEGTALETILLILEVSLHNIPLHSDH